VFLRRDSENNMSSFKEVIITTDTDATGMTLKGNDLTLNNANGTTGGVDYCEISLKNRSDKYIIRILGEDASIRTGGNGRNGEIAIYSGDKDNGKIEDAVIHINGKTGDITFRNGDCAELFEVSRSEMFEPGDLAVIGANGTLEKSCEPYDKRVAGVIAGAGPCKPAIILGNEATKCDQLPITLIGKAYCKADATYGAIEVGDLLTTSLTAGHAMKVDELSKAGGAIIGKALAALVSGIGLIPVLVALH
jgi:hypothetical protein